ncbi:Uncharacterized protein TCM_012194 [Theobroma cacao]|uniref:Uncharacterized protein n=1 Tax=Theobroma cacao TaxID=3641 RepID=A0A061FTV2_THECC|nr:Uncharacterized protein TCM_012194 [Theobroma cacao]
MEDDPEPDIALHFFQNFLCFLKMDGIGKTKAEQELQSCYSIIRAVLSSGHWRGLEQFRLWGVHVCMFAAPVGTTRFVDKSIKIVWMGPSSIASSKEQYEKLFRSFKGMG